MPPGVLGGAFFRIPFGFEFARDTVGGWCAFGSCAAAISVEAIAAGCDVQMRRMCGAQGDMRAGREGCRRDEKWIGVREEKWDDACRMSEEQARGAAFMARSGNGRAVSAPSPTLAAEAPASSPLELRALRSRLL